MTQAAKKIMVRVIKRRLEAGDRFDKIIQDYPKLTKKEIEELKEAVGEK